jgi:energy-coupling factor transporter ATP-binding protein EcfA2
MPFLFPEDPLTYLGLTDFRNERKRFGIKLTDRRRHLWILGKTGTGKSTLLEHMAIADIGAGRGLCVVDPHGDFAEKLLDFVPSSRTNEVIYWDPADRDFPIGLNVLEAVPPASRAAMASSLMSVFKKIWPDNWSQRMEYYLGNALATLLEYPNATLLSVNRLFADAAFREKVLQWVKDPIVRAFWEKEVARLSGDYVREAAAAIQNKAGQFGTNEMIRHIVGQRTSAIDFRAVMDEGKILIVNLSKGRLGDEASRLLGALIVTKLYLAAMIRVDTPEPERRDFSLYVDEFQNFATEAFAHILSESRKYRLGLVLANQFISQMDPVIQDAIFGNVGSMVFFRMGAQDAEIVEKELAPRFSRDDLVNLDIGRIYVKLMIDGVTAPAFSAETLPPLPSPTESRRELLIRLCRERYGTPRETVEAAIRRFL